MCKHHKHEKESNFKNNLDSMSFNTNLFILSLHSTFSSSPIHRLQSYHIAHKFYQILFSKTSGAAFQSIQLKNKNHRHKYTESKAKDIISINSNPQNKQRNKQVSIASIAIYCNRPRL